jgi:hypothetical protein
MVPYNKKLQEEPGHRPKLAQTAKIFMVVRAVTALVQ